MQPEDDKAVPPPATQSDVTMYKPDKPLREMTRAEVDALAERIFRRFVAANPPTEPPPDAEE